MTSTAMRHCLAVVGATLTQSELMALDSSFRSTSRPEMIAWKDFCRAAVAAARRPSSGRPSEVEAKECAETSSTMDVRLFYHQCLLSISTLTSSFPLANFWNNAVVTGGRHFFTLLIRTSLLFHRAEGLAFLLLLELHRMLTFPPAIPFAERLKNLR